MSFVACARSQEVRIDECKHGKYSGGKEHCAHE
jgi:hypothetical protein